MGKRVPLPPILQGHLAAGFIGPDETFESARQIANSSQGWHALTYALGVSGPSNVVNAKRSLHGVEAIMRRHRR